MITLSQLTQFLGWAAVINLAYLLLATVIVVFMGGALASLHGKFFKLSNNQLEAKYFGFLSQYKILTQVFFVAPYVALKIIGQ